VYDSDAAGRKLCDDFLTRVTRDVDSDARHAMKLELRRDLLRRFRNERQRDVDFSLKIIMTEKMQNILAAYLESLRARKK
jgi:hypothetical protein